MKSLRPCRAVSRLSAAASILALAAGAWGVGEASAACSTNAPREGATVTCSPEGGVDTRGIQGEGVRDVTVTVTGPGGGIAPAGTATAIDLGLFATLDLSADAPIVARGYGVEVDYGATITGGNILSSGKGLNAVRAGDRLTMTLGEKDKVVSTGNGGTAIHAGTEALITVGGLVSATNSTDEEAAASPGSGIFARQGSRIVVTETGRIEASGIGTSGIQAFADSSVTVNGSILASGAESIGLGNAIDIRQGATVVVGKSGLVRSSGTGSAAIALGGDVGDYTTSLLGTVSIAGRVEATGAGGAAVALDAARTPFLSTDLERPSAEVSVAEGAVVSSAQSIAIFDRPGSPSRFDVDTTVRIAGRVESLEQDGLAVALSGGNDTVVLLPTYSIAGIVLASNTDAEGTVINSEGEVDTFALDGAAGTEGRFDFAPGGADRVLGFERFEKRGAGLWTLEGGPSEIPITGTVAEGELAVDAAASGFDLTVAKGAVLSGTGTVGALALEAGGTVAPGDGGGRLTVSGAADLSEGTLLIALAADGTPALLDVAGKAVIAGGTLALDGMPAGLGKDGDWVVLKAAKGVEGRFERVTDDLPDLDLEALYGADTVSLGFTEAAPGSAVTEKGVHAETLSALLEADLGFARLLRAQGAPGLAGSPAPAPAPQAYAATENFTHRADLPASFAEPAPAHPTPRAWIAGLGASLDVDGEGGTAGFDATSGGLAAGFDLSTPLGGGVFTVGLAAGYQSLDVDSGGSSADADIGRAGLYAAFLSGPLMLDGALAYGRADIETRRDLGFDAAEAQADADLFSASASAAYNLAPALGLAPAAVLAPRATLDLASVSRDGFTEEGAGILDLSAESESAFRGAAGIGVVLGTRLETGEGWSVAPEVSVAYQRLFGDRAVDASLEIASAGAGFEPEAAPAARDRLALGAGLTVESGRGLSLTLGYDGAFGSGFESQTGSLSLGYRF